MKLPGERSAPLSYPLVFSNSVTTNLSPSEPSMAISEGEQETVAVLGLGRLGLCFAVVLEQAGYRVGPPGARVCSCQRPSVAARAAMRLLEARAEV